MLDKEGTAFDPALHYVDKDGRGQLTKGGVWRKKGGRKEAPLSVVARLEALEKALAQKDAKIAQLEKPAGDPVMAALTTARIREAVEEMERTRRSVPTPGGATERRPYRGHVQAKVDCHYHGYYKAGEVFEVDVPCLWTDDPYAPVILKGYSELGTPLTESNPAAPPAVDFELRMRTSEALALENARYISGGVQVPLAGGAVPVVPAKH